MAEAIASRSFQPLRWLVCWISSRLHRARLRRCAMCDDKTWYALDPRDRGLEGKVVPLCGRCFNDDGKLRHAVAFANVLWRKSE